jgi:hypothetical protein
VIAAFRRKYSAHAAPTNSDLSLEWRQVDFGAGEVRLDPGKTKNGAGRTLPMTRELRELSVG